MAAGLFYVYTDPGTIDEAEFHDWYDHEHGPARLTVPGLGPAYRYRALDELKPTWLALYELDRPDVIESPAYKALSAKASDRGQVSIPPPECRGRLAPQGTHRTLPSRPRGPRGRNRQASNREPRKDR